MCNHSIPQQKYKSPLALFLSPFFNPEFWWIKFQNIWVWNNKLIKMDHWRDATFKYSKNGQELFYFLWISLSLTMITTQHSDGLLPLTAISPPFSILACKVKRIILLYFFLFFFTNNIAFSSHSHSYTQKRKT